MTTTEFISGSSIARTDITEWAQRGVDLTDETTIAKADKKLAFLRAHLARYAQTATLDMDATITVARTKVADHGVGETITLSTGETFAAVDGAFRIVKADGTTEVPTLASAKAAKAKEKPIAEAAAPAKPKKTKNAKAVKEEQPATEEPMADPAEIPVELTAAPKSKPVRRGKKVDMLADL